MLLLVYSCADILSNPDELESLSEAKHIKPVLLRPT